jgi:3-oxoacyl-(acyl-carrier-protein) synthase
MDVFITGTGWITPLGAGLDEVWEAILGGAPAPTRELAGPVGTKAHRAATAPPKLVDDVAQNGRLRRSSNISLFAAGAAGAALKNDEDNPSRMRTCAVITSICDGGVIYSRRFYDQVVKKETASPLLFPETVYNAPASHIAALLGMDGITYTLVGDASAGLAAVELGVELLEAGEVDRCLIVGAEEADWILGEAYRQWRLPALMADGAAAIVLSREGKIRLEGVSGGVPFFRQREAGASLRAALGELPRGAKPCRVISCANGTFVDEAERGAVEAVYGRLPTVYPKKSLGDAYGASALMQIVCAVQSIRREPTGPVLVPVIGLNHQAAAALISAG